MGDSSRQMRKLLIVAAALLAPVVPKEQGGYGLGPYTGEVFPLWMMTKEIARADMSLARCWEGHVNSLVLLDGMATEDQKSRWFRGVVERGVMRPREMSPAEGRGGEGLREMGVRRFSPKWRARQTRVWSVVRRRFTMLGV